MTTTTTQYFAGCSTVAEVKKLYRDLAFKNHPDMGGTTETMQEINRQYEQALRNCDGQEAPGDDGHIHTYRYKHEREQDVMQAIDKLLALLHPEIMNGNVDIWLIGCWIWIKGKGESTKPYRAGLKEIGCRWSNEKTAWYWREEGQRSFRSGKSIAGLAATYGATDLAEEARRKGNSGYKRGNKKGGRALKS